jgi:hypothetical protein
MLKLKCKFTQTRIPLFQMDKVNRSGGQSSLDSSIHVEMAILLMGLNVYLVWVSNSYLTILSTLL